MQKPPSGAAFFLWSTAVAAVAKDAEGGVGVVAFLFRQPTRGLHAKVC